MNNSTQDCTNQIISGSSMKQKVDNFTTSQKHLQNSISNNHFVISIKKCDEQNYLKKNLSELFLSFQLYFWHYQHLIFSEKLYKKINSSDKEVVVLSSRDEFLDQLIVKTYLKKRIISLYNKFNTQSYNFITADGLISIIKSIILNSENIYKKIYTKNIKKSNPKRDFKKH